MASEGYKPLAGPAVWAQRALIALSLLNVIGIASDLAAHSLYQSELVTSDEIDATDARQAVIGLVQFIGLIAAIAFFVRWFRRAYRNLPALGAETLRFRRGWAVWGWFVPILGWFRPKQIANDIWRASDPEAPPAEGGPSRWQEKPVSGLFQLWWAAYLISTFLDNVAARYSLRADDVDGYDAEAVAYMVADTAAIVAAVLAVLVIRRTTARQEARAARLVAELEPSARALT
jgi:hypothetical protein